MKAPRYQPGPTRIDTHKLERALCEVLDAHFECGSWTRDSDDTYDLLHERATRAEAMVWTVLGVTRPEVVPGCTDDKHRFPMPGTWRCACGAEIKEAKRV